MNDPIEVDANPAHTVARVDDPARRQGHRRRRRTRRSRRCATRSLPATIGKLAGVEYAVTGDDRGRRRTANAR